MNSANVTGGAPPLLPQARRPQSPVVQFPFPEASKLQPVRAQNRPDQPVCAVNATDSPGGKTNPPPPSVAAPLAAKLPGQTVDEHLFDSVKTVADAVLPDKITTKQL